MGRITAGMAVFSLCVIATTGCVEDRTEDSHSLFLFNGDQVKGAVPQTSEAPAPSAVIDGTSANMSPASILFVAYVATPPDVVNVMLKMAHVSREDVVCDLGCGDGRIVVTAVKRYGCRAVGYDLDPLRVQEARKNAEDHRVAHRVRIEQKDILEADLSEATVVTMYLGRQLNTRLIPQLAKLGAGARIVSHDFDLAGIPPDKVVRVTSNTDRRVHTVYLWNCPLKAADRRPTPTR